MLNDFISFLVSMSLGGFVMVALYVVYALGHLPRYYRKGR